MILISFIHMFCHWNVNADVLTSGVGLSKSQLNDFTRHFVQSNKEHVKVEGQKVSPAQNLVKSKRYNFSSPFLLEDRLLLVRLYNKYTEENCMTFKKFAIKFRKKANEWGNGAGGEGMEMWEKRKGRLMESLGGVESFGDLENMTEKELLEILLSLESEEDTNSIETEFDIFENDLDIYETNSEVNNTEKPSDLQKQQQDQSQQVHAEIHTHNHYYLIQGKDGSIHELPNLENKDPDTVQEYLNSTDQNTLTSPNSDLMNPTVTSPFSTLPNENVDGNSTSDSSSNMCMCPSSTMSSYNNMYQVDNSQLSTDFITLTTSSPLDPSFSPTVSQTTLPPVEIPSNSTAAQVSSLPADLPSTIPTPENRNGVFSCGKSSSGVTTNFVNPSYPGYDSTTGVCQFHLVLHSDVCQVRVDFVDTAFLPPVNGECSLQRLTIGGTVWPIGVKSFCGVNSDQHFYIETLDDGQSSKFVEFSVTTEKSSDYKWGLWITQIFCDGTRTIQAPTGCFQYHFDYSGIVQSFNYAGGQYFNDQHYRICILASNDACRIDYRSEGEFMLEKWGNYKTNPYTRAGVTSQYCVRDYLQIPGGFGGDQSLSHDRFCGGELSSSHGARTSQPVVTSVKSRLSTLEFHSGTPEGEYKFEHHNPGFRVRYKQMACV